MRVILKISIIFLLFSSCEKSYRTLEEGIWFHEKFQNQQILILKKNDSLFLKYSGEEPSYIYESKYNDFIINDDKKLQIWKEGKNIHFAKNVYIPKEKTLRHQFIGTWKNKKNGLSIHIFKDNFQWTISDGQKNISASFYPKQTKNGYKITFDGKIVEFQFEGNYLIDSNGLKYFKEDSE